MECSLAQVGANTAWTLIIATLVIGVGAAALVFSRRKAPALAMMVHAIGVVGAGAGTAAAGSAACEPVCFDLDASDVFFDNPPPDLLLESDDGVHVQAYAFASADGSCSGSSSQVGTGAIAETEAEAEAICGGPVVNLAASFPAGTLPVPAANVWGCIDEA